LPVFLCGIDIDQLVLLQVFRLLQRIVALQQLRRADRHEVGLEERTVIVARRLVAGEDDAEVHVAVIKVPVEI
jgi:hypothetical protein